ADRAGHTRAWRLARGCIRGAPCFRRSRSPERPARAAREPQRVETRMLAQAHLRAAFARHSRQAFLLSWHPDSSLNDRDGRPAVAPTARALIAMALQKRLRTPRVTRRPSAFAYCGS